MTVGRGMGATYTLDIDDRQVEQAFARIERRGATVAGSLGKGLARAMSKGKDSVKSVNESLIDLEKKGKSSFSGMGRSFKSVFRSLGAISKRFAFSLSRDISQSIQRISKEILDLSSTFETAMAGVATLIDEKALPGLGRFSDELGRISRTGDQSVKVLAEAAYQAISATGDTLEKTAKLIQQADYMATAGRSGADIAVKSLTIIKNTFGDTAGSFKNISDILFQTVKKGVTDFPKLARALGNVAAIASNAGVKFKTTMAAFVALTKSGVESRKSMMLLKNLISAIQNPSQQAAARFNKLGIEYGTAAIKANGLMGIMAQIREKIKGNADEFKKLFPNIRSTQAAATLAGKQFHVFRDAMDSIQNSAGATALAYEKFTDTYKFQSDRFKNILNSIYRKAASEAFDTLKDLLVLSNKWLEENRGQLVTWGKQLSKGLIDVTLRLGALAKGFAHAASELKPLVKAAWAIAKIPFSKAIWASGEIARMSKIRAEALKDTLRLQKLIEKEQKKQYEKQRQFSTKSKFFFPQKSKYTIEYDTPKRPKKELTKTQIREILQRAKEEQSVYGDALARNHREIIAQIKRQEREKAAFIKRQEKGIWTAINATSVPSIGALEAQAQKIVEARAKATAKAETSLAATASKAKGDRGSFFDIAFGTDAELKQRFGEKLNKIGSSVAEFRDAIKSSYAPDLIASAATFWATLIGTGRKGAEAYASAIGNTFQTLAQGILSAWTDMFQGLISGSDNWGMLLVSAVLKTISTIAGQWALFYVAQGIAFLAAQAYANAALSFLAAGAFGILAGAAAAGSAAASTAAGSSSAPSSASSGGGQVRDNTRADSAKSGDLTVNIHYGTMMPANKRQIQEFGEATVRAINSIVHTGNGIDTRVLRKVGS